MRTVQLFLAVTLSTRALCQACALPDLLLSIDSLVYKQCSATVQIFARYLYEPLASKGVFFYDSDWVDPLQKWAQFNPLSEAIAVRLNFKKHFSRWIFEDFGNLGVQNPNLCSDACSKH
jgi:hypothetical protein